MWPKRHDLPLFLLVGFLTVPASRAGVFLNRRSDPLFELCDAILTAGAVLSPAHLRASKWSPGAGGAASMRP